MVKDFYAVLSVSRQAKPAEIKKRFRELARERHPDRFLGPDKADAETAFQDLTEAFNVLMDPVRRRQHDMELDRPPGKPTHDPKQVVRVYLNRGIRAYKLNNFAEAADSFERATKADATSYQAWHHLALTCAKEKKWLPKAQEAIVKACELRPKHVPYLKLAGKIFGLSGIAPKAKQYYNEALNLGGTDPSIRKALQALGNAPDEEQGEGEAGLFRKMW